MSSSAAARTPAETELTPDSDTDDDLALEKHEHGPADGSSETERLRKPRTGESSKDEEQSLSDTSEDDEVDVPSSSRNIQRTSTASKSYTTEEEETVMRKLDRRLILFLSLLYLLSFLDRSNIGNARIAGLDTSLALSSAQYDWLLTAFYITYITFEWMILLYKVVPPRIYIPLCVASWGIVASLQSLARSFSQLLVLRALLGVTEAAFGPGVPFYMTFFYRRSELAYRVGLQISAAPLATSFAASLAWCIVKINTAIGSPIESWRALFLVEGFPSLIAAVAAWYLIPNSPATTRWLNPRERRVATLRLKEERDKSSIPVLPSSTPPTGTRKFFGIDLTELKHTLSDPKAYAQALMFFSVNVSFASLPVFLPTIINSMNFSAVTSQALAAPPYLCAFAAVLTVGYYSDRIPDSRSIFLAGVAFLSAASYALIAIAGALHDRIGEAGSITLRYIGVYPAAIGLFCAVTLIITWTLNNQQSSTGKGMAMTILNVFGQCGPLVGVHLFPKSQGPLYVPGMAVCAGFMAGVGAIAVGLRVYLMILNRRADGDGSRGTYEMVGVGEADGEGDEGAKEGLIGGGRKEEGFRFML